MNARSRRLATVMHFARTRMEVTPALVWISIQAMVLRALVSLLFLGVKMCAVPVRSCPAS